MDMKKEGFNEDINVCYLYRSKKLNQYSIENVFRYIRDSLKDKLKINESFVPNGRIGVKEIINNLMHVRNIEADIFHITGDIHYVSLVLPKKKTILTIHDLVGFENFNNNKLKKILYYFLWIFIPSFKCKYITVISEKTRDDLIKVCPWARGKTTIIPDPISPLFKYSEKEFDIIRPKILLIGTSQNKNHERIIKAIKNINCELLIVGKLSEEERMILNRENILFSNYYMISEDEIVELYKFCDIVLFPSTYEGFGMPIIEGQRTGRCVITSNLEPMKSVAGGAACLVNPYDVWDIEQKILKVINDKAYRDKLIEKGLINSHSYTSDKIASLYEQIYRKIEH